MDKNASVPEHPLWNIPESAPGNASPAVDPRPYKERAAELGGRASPPRPGSFALPLFAFLANADPSTRAAGDSRRVLVSGGVTIIIYDILVCDLPNMQNDNR